MPFKTVNVKAELFFSFHGVKIYHTYKYDDVSQGSRVNWFVINDPYVSEEDNPDCFDVREIPGFNWNGVQYGEDYENYQKEVIRMAIKQSVQPFDNL